MCSHGIINTICRKKHKNLNVISSYLVQEFIKIDRGIICLCFFFLKWTLNAFEMIIRSTSVQTSGWAYKCVQEKAVFIGAFMGLKQQLLSS